MTTKYDGLEMIGHLPSEKLIHVGTLDRDALVTKHGCSIIDMNPRIVAES